MTFLNTIKTFKEKTGKKNLTKEEVLTLKELYDTFVENNFPEDYIPIINNMDILVRNYKEYKISKNLGSHVYYSELKSFEDMIELCNAQGEVLEEALEEYPYIVHSESILFQEALKAGINECYSDILKAEKNKIDSDNNADDDDYNDDDDDDEKEEDVIDYLLSHVTIEPYTEFKFDNSTITDKLNKSIERIKNLPIQTQELFLQWIDSAIEMNSNFLNSANK